MASASPGPIPANGSPITLVADLLLDAGCSERSATLMLSKALMIRTLERNKGNLCRAAHQLDLHRNTLTRRLSELGLNSLPQSIRDQQRSQLSIAFSKKRPRAGSVGKPLERAV
jgi:hypothetical protein